jgi:hypothetical protein
MHYIQNKPSFTFIQMVLSQTRREMGGRGIYCKLYSFYLTLGLHVTHCGRGLEAMEIALMKLFSRIGCFKMAVICSDSDRDIQSLAKVDAPPSKRVTESFIY